MSKINIEKKIKEFSKELENEKDVSEIIIRIGRVDGITISYDWDDDRRNGEEE